MHDLQTTQDKLLRTPSGDVHSPFYRKLVSAGYKGHIGGAIGGGALYGVIGLVVGTLVGGAFAVLTNGASLLLIPALGGYGILHGVKVFADIGTTAAIVAESAEIREKRQHLLERFYETDSPDERVEIQKLLDEQVEPKPPERLFHWRTLVIGALVGGAIALSLGFGVNLLELNQILTHFLGHETIAILEKATLIEGGQIGALAIGVFTAIGASVGAFIGLDREYVRRFLDYSENVMNDPSHQHEQHRAKVKEVARLSDASMGNTLESNTAASTITRDSIRPAPNAPDAKAVSQVLHENRIVMPQLSNAVH